MHFSVDTDRLGTTAEGLSSVTADLERIRSRLENAITDQGRNPEGTGEVGRAYAEHVGKPATDARRALADVVKVLRSAEEGVRTMQRGFDHVEHTNIDAVGNALKHEQLGERADAGRRG